MTFYKTLLSINIVYKLNSFIFYEKFKIFYTNPPQLRGIKINLPLNYSQRD